MTTTPTNQRSAWDKPAQSIALQLQRRQNNAHAPAQASYICIPKAGSYHSTQRIEKAEI